MAISIEREEELLSNWLSETDKTLQYWRTTMNLEEYFYVKYLDWCKQQIL